VDSYPKIERWYGPSEGLPPDIPALDRYGIPYLLWLCAGGTLLLSPNLRIINSDSLSNLQLSTVASFTGRHFDPAPHERSGSNLLVHLLKVMYRSSYYVETEYYRGGLKVCPTLWVSRRFLLATNNVSAWYVGTARAVESGASTDMTQMWSSPTRILSNK